MTDSGGSTLVNTFTCSTIQTCFYIFSNMIYAFILFYVPVCVRLHDKRGVFVDLSDLL